MLVRCWNVKPTDVTFCVSFDSRSGYYIFQNLKIHNFVLLPWAAYSMMIKNSFINQGEKLRFFLHLRFFIRSILKQALQSLLNICDNRVWSTMNQTCQFLVNQRLSWICGPTKNERKANHKVQAKLPWCAKLAFNVTKPSCARKSPINICTCPLLQKMWRFVRLKNVKEYVLCNTSTYLLLSVNTYLLLTNMYSVHSWLCTMYIRTT